jgi:hypothetical protein
MTRSLPVASSLKAAVVFVPKALANAPGVLLLFFLVLLLPIAPQLTGIAPPVPATWARAGVAVLLLIVGTATEGALYRLALTDTRQAARSLGLGPLGLQFGDAEFRLLAAGFLVSLFVGLVVLAISLVATIVAGALNLDLATNAFDVGGEGWRLWVWAGVRLAALWIVVQLIVRLLPYKAATVARGRIVSLNAMGLSEHNFWRLLAGGLISSSPLLILGALRGWNGLPTVWRMVAGAGVVAFIQTPLWIGFLARAYKSLEYWREHPGEG